LDLDLKRRKSKHNSTPPSFDFLTFRDDVVIAQYLTAMAHVLAQTQ
jgi:hypothetical protein